MSAFERGGGKQVRRFFRTGPRQVLRDGLGVQGHDQVSDVANTIQPVHEVRALRPHEYFSEGFVRWGFAITSGAIAGEFSGIAVGCFSNVASTVRVPGTIVVIDHIVVSTGTGVFKLLDEALMLATLGTGAFAFVTDTRWGEAGVTAVAVPFFTGSDLAQQGSTIGQSATGLQSVVPIVIQRPPEGKPATALVAWGSAVNSALALEMGGYIVPPK